MQLEMTEEQVLIVAMVRRFVREEIVPLELNLDPDTDTLDPDDEARLTGLVKEMGLYGMRIPPEYGGPDMDMVTRTLVAMEGAAEPEIYGHFSELHPYFKRCASGSERDRSCARTLRKFRKIASVFQVMRER